MLTSDQSSYHSRRHEPLVIGWSNVSVRASTWYKALLPDCAPTEIRGLFTPRDAVSARETRATDRGSLHLHRCRLTSSQSTFSYRVAVEWNRLTHSVRATPTLRGFKTAIR